MNADLPIERRGRIVPPGPGFLAALGWCLTLILLMIAAMIGFAVVDIAIRHAGEAGIMDRISDEAQSFQTTQKLGPILERAFGLGFLGAGLVSLGYTLLIVRSRIGRDWPRKLAVRFPRWDHLLLCLLGLPALMVLHGGAHQLANWLFQVDPQASDMSQTMLQIVEPWPRWLTILVIGVAPGIGEELWCRGFLGRGLIARHGWFLGVLLTSLLFGMLHLSPPYALGTAAMGACLHMTYLTTRSLWVPILLHTLNNSLTMLLALGDVPLGNANPDQVESPLLYAASGVLALMVGVALFRSRGKLVDATGEPIRTPFPTLGLPTPESGHQVRHDEVILWHWVGAVAAAIWFGVELARLM